MEEKKLAEQFLSCRAVCGCVQKLDKHTLISLTIIKLTIKYLIRCLILLATNTLSTYISHSPTYLLTSFYTIFSLQRTLQLESFPQTKIKEVK